MGSHVLRAKVVGERRRALSLHLPLLGRDGRHLCGQLLRTELAGEGEKFTNRSFKPRAEASRSHGLRDRR
jgi:hypothetical protein